MKTTKPKNTSKRILVRPYALSAVALLGVLTACNTVSGVGKDVKAAGGAVSDTAQETKAYDDNGNKIPSSNSYDENGNYVPPAERH